MALVRQSLFLCTFLNDFKGVLLAFEYAWFLLQQTKDAGNSSASIISVATNAYQTSGTQAAVFNAFQPVIMEHCDNHDILKDVIIGIIHEHCMCKSITIKAISTGRV